MLENSIVSDRFDSEPQVREFVECLARALARRWIQDERGNSSSTELKSQKLKAAKNNLTD